jgi:hypothetical protein
MAETYLTPTFQNAAKPQDQSTTGGEQTGGEQYQTPAFQKAAQGDGGQQTAQPSQGWGIDWSKPGGEITMPQSVQDWTNVAGNEAMAYGVPGLRTAAEAARKRLDPATAASADFAGNLMSPTQLLNVFGPEAAGAAHEGIKSYMSQPNWIPDAAGAAKIGEDTAFGAATGGFGRGVASQAPKYFGDATKELVRGLPAGFLGLHMFNAGADAAHHMATAAETLGLYGGLKKLGDWAGTKVEDLGSSPAVQQAIKSVILGGGSAVRQQIPGPLDQLFMPGN